MPPCRKNQKVLCEKTHRGRINRGTTSVSRILTEYGLSGTDGQADLCPRTVTCAHVAAYAFASVRCSRNVFRALCLTALHRPAALRKELRITSFQSLHFFFQNITFFSVCQVLRSNFVNIFLHRFSDRIQAAPRALSAAGIYAKSVVTCVFLLIYSRKRYII